MSSSVICPVSVGHWLRVQWVTPKKLLPLSSWWQLKWQLSWLNSGEISIPIMKLITGNVINVVHIKMKSIHINNAYSTTFFSKLKLPCVNSNILVEWAIKFHFFHWSWIVFVSPKRNKIFHLSKKQIDLILSGWIKGCLWHIFVHIYSNRTLV